MNNVSIGSPGSPVEVNDWYMLFMVMSFVLNLLFIGSYTHSYAKGLSNMFRFSSPDSDLVYPHYSPSGYVIIPLLSCIDLGLAFVLYTHDVSVAGTSLASSFLSATGFFGLFFLFKVALYQGVNKALYEPQSITMKPIRWNIFFIMVFSASSFFILTLSAIVLFMELDSRLLLSGVLLILLIMETGVVFKIKTALFRNKCSTYGFILYLCALEFLPVILMAVVLGIIISSL